MNKPHPTLADYLVIAVSPVLIMTLVGSLVFFLLAVFYQGQFEVRLNAVMALFVLAAVLIGRISIDEGREYAAAFAIPLGIVTWRAMAQFVEFQGPLSAWSVWINAALIAAIWWCADRLTWDCTFIDESKDASGEGLLQTVGLDRDPAAQSAAEDPRVDLEATTSREESSAARPALSRSLWRRFVESRRRPHPHGVWVVYFSLAALPIFGFGQWLVPAQDLASRRYVFQLLIVYMASALGLLLTTSFLGLRRYLRQRRLEMPSDMAVAWGGVGATMVVAILVLCLSMPRRNPEYSLTQLPLIASSPADLRTSRFGPGRDGPRKTHADRAARQNEEPPEGRQSDQAPSSDARQAPQAPSAEDHARPNGQDNATQGQAEQTSGEASADQRRKSQETRDRGEAAPSGEKQQEQVGDEDGRSSTRDSSPRSDLKTPPPPTLDFGTGLAGLLRLLYWLAVAIIVAYLLIRYRAQVLRALRDFVKSLRELWSRLFTARPNGRAADEATAAASGVPPRPFADFPDPFASGQAQSWSIDELVQYSFQAFEAWARERGCPRAPDQTPSEFVRAVASRESTVRQVALQLAQLYNASAYGHGAASPASLAPLRQLWQALRARTAA